MTFLFESPREQNLIREISKFAKKRRIKLYLVGGIVRDMLLKREKENLDIDFCLRNQAISFAKALAREIRAGFVLLDKEHGSCRLVKKIEKSVYTLDFTDFRGKTLEDDLLHRDFVINAMSMELDKVLNARPTLSDKDLDGLIIDPYGGRRDLKSKTIRAVNKKAFDEDPLRILRAFSLAILFGFTIDKETIKLIKLKCRKLSGVSYERIRDELFKIFHQPGSFNYLLDMDKLKILEIVIPEIGIMRGIKQGPYHHLDVWKHTLETIKQLEDLLVGLKKNKEIQEYLNEVISSDRKRLALIKLAALLHDIGKPKALRREKGKTIFHGHERIGRDMAENIVRYLKLSNDESDSLSKMVFLHLRPGYLADNEEVTPRAIFRFFRDAGQESVSILLLSIADQRATRGPLTSKETRLQHERVNLDLIKENFRRRKEKKPERFITGDDLIKEFKLEPSPTIGKILRELEELQAIGKIKTKKEAFSAARKFMDKSQKEVICSKSKK
jgi:poly(A) polymerase